MTDVDVPFDTSGLNEPTTGVHSFGGGSVSASEVRVGFVESPPHPESALRANSDLSPQAGRGEGQLIRISAS
ncbi:hypothetical protein EAS62_37970 [Bradyrhizobium zhanjiangense]|uniref:Uncharacterized protein n=1 Tax=Bradyrhizobium zhanjiangense TaxID=1325107 RepID=A0ABY0D931_9BRAD|nr:hypothetical protein EAS62_37970 [Bradyrhizobium zhanjiangense]